MTRLASLALLLGCASSAPAPRRAAPRSLPPPAPLRAEPVAQGVLRAIPLRGGRTLTLYADGRFERALGEAVDARRELASPERCALRDWGERGFAACEGEGESALFDDPGRALGVLRGGLSGVIGSRDGGALGRSGACDPERVPESPRESAGCRWTDGAGWRTWTMDRDGVSLIDIAGQHALVRWSERTELPARSAITHEVVGLFDIDRGQWLPLTPSEPTARWVCAAFGRDRRVHALIHTGTEASPRAWHATGAGPRLQARPLPFVAEDFAVVDDLRMVAVRGGEAALLRDEQRAVPIRGDAAFDAPRWRHATRCGERVQCDGARCAIDGRWWVTVPSARDPLAR